MGLYAANGIGFIIHVTTGVLFWGEAFWSSVAYNSWNMIPTLLAGLIFTPLILKRIPKINH
jgi:thiamine transporter ThiT